MSFLSIQLLNELLYLFHLTYNLSPFFITFSMSFFLAKFACFILAVKLSDVNLLNSFVITYLS